MTAITPTESIRILQDRIDSINERVAEINAVRKEYVAKVKTADTDLLALKQQREELMESIRILERHAQSLTTETMAGWHGHVRPRPDGAKARCGGPSLCKTCQKEQQMLCLQTQTLGEEIVTPGKGPWG